MNTYYIALFALLSVVLGAAAVLMHQKLHRCEKQMRDLHLQKTQEYADSIHFHMIQESLGIRQSKLLTNSQKKKISE